MKRKGLIAVTVGVATVAATTLYTAPVNAAGQTTPGTSNATTADPGSDPRALAAQAADKAVAEGLGVLRRGPEESFERTGVTSGADGTQYVGYERAYKGLPVVGGDAVVVTDAAGKIMDTVAATGPTGDVALTPKVSTRSALKVAKARLSQVDKAEQPRLVVRAGEKGERLAWEVAVSGVADRKPSVQHVFVDALDGSVIDAYDLVKYGTGNGFYNGQVTISTSGSAGSYTMKDPTRNGLACGGQNGAPYTKDVDSWGDGTGTSLETGCVDAFWAAQKMWDMLRDWFGYNGFNGRGGGFPTRVGMNDANAYWSGSYAVFGRNRANTQQATALDVIGHEYGHAIFQFAGSGSMGTGNEFGGLNESAGDIFGTLLEHYANVPGDPPDYTIGEEVDLLGTGPIRNMANPSLIDSAPNCYSSTIPITEVHAAAGPQNHWFYLLAEGTHPGGGKPNSPVCSGPPYLAGIGIKKAGKIFLNALLRRTSTWRHTDVHRATLAAAAELYGSRSVEYAAVWAAWRAVNVPSATPTPPPVPVPTVTPVVAPTGPGDPPGVSLANVKAHLQQFQSIASSNGGTRRSTGAGYTASVTYIENKLRAAGYTVTRQSCTSGCSRGAGPNLIADWPGGDVNQVIMAGAHLDSVSAGPGINDNGSGSASLLEVALTLAQYRPTLAKHVRFGWWTDEEQGLLGSKFYVNSLGSAGRSKIKRYLNFDMVGSRNGGYFINNISTAAAADLKAFYNQIGVQTEENVEGANRSDDASFRNGGIPTSGVAAGASARKTYAQASKWGGTANQPYDSCYHSACDTTSNINDTILDRAADATLYAIWRAAMSAGPTLAQPQP
ncbi:M28 family peptidase [Streptosporangium sp. NPDC020145]|uniref:M28 family peptidase n=1 Tax=Streptosporangium sp. NPDC020145 TaxID=3154694 RepID=UPI003419DF65